ncbi:spore coat protein GerQ [Fictibacillus sp. Mic-4]|uniref:spore coat protein GerQ n=1 Tax=Fictibacillus sp. Mic-4 TaxID=3132826 RepID=UPI003CFB4D5F
MNNQGNGDGMIGMPPYYGSIPQMGMPRQQGSYAYPGTTSVPQPSVQGPGSPMYPPSPPDIAAPGHLPLEQSYIENILRLNKGKVATVYCTFENNEKWNAKAFKGEIEAAGRDHIILEDPQTHRRYLILMVFVNYITFDEPIEYTYPYAGQQQTGSQMATYPSR